MSLFRCCQGDTYVAPNHLPSDASTSWAVLCLDCGAVLAVVDGVDREEVYAEL